MSKTTILRNTLDTRPVIMMVIGGLGAGGKEQQLLSLLKGLKQRNNYSIVLVVMNPNGSRESEALEYIENLFVIKRIFSFDIFSPLIRIVQVARKLNLSLIHTWGSGIWDFLGLCVSRWLKIRYLHGGIRSAPATLNFNNRLSKWCAKRADAVVANSQAGLMAFGQEKNPKAKVIYNGLDLSRFEGIKPISSEYDICMVANFSQNKDHQTLVNSMAIIFKAFPQAKLLLVGHDAGNLSITKTLVNRLGLDDSVIFVTDCLKPWQLIANSIIGVLATNQTIHGEGISNAILEYMMFSKPVVASDNGGNSEVIVPGMNGYLVESGSAEAIADKIILLLENPDLAKKMGILGKEMVIKNFGMNRMIDSYESIYMDLIKEP